MEVSFALRQLHPEGKSPWYPLDGRLDEPQSRPGHGGEEKVPYFAGTRTPELELHMLFIFIHETDFSFTVLILFFSFVTFSLLCKLFV
jgi:hypothetical protein